MRVLKAFRSLPVPLTAGLLLLLLSASVYRSSTPSSYRPISLSDREQTSTPDPEAGEYVFSFLSGLPSAEMVTLVQQARAVRTESFFGSPCPALIALYLYRDRSDSAYAEIPLSFSRHLPDLKGPVRFPEAVGVKTMRLYPFWPCADWAAMVFPPEETTSSGDFTLQSPQENRGVNVERLTAGIGGHHEAQSGLVPITLSLRGLSGGFSGSFLVNRRGHQWSCQVTVGEGERRSFELEVIPAQGAPESFEAALIRYGEQKPCWFRTLRIVTGTGSQYWIHTAPGSRSGAHERFIGFRVRQSRAEPRQNSGQSSAVNRTAPPQELQNGPENYLFGVDPLNAPLSSEGWSGASRIFVDGNSFALMEKSARSALLTWQAEGGTVIWLPSPRGATGSPAVPDQNTRLLAALSRGSNHEPGEGPEQLLNLGAPAPPSLRLPSAAAVALLMGTFFLLFGPLSQRIMRRSRRVLHAWFILPGVALCFTLIVLMLSFAHPTPAQYHAVTVQRVESGAGIGRVLSQVSYFNPRGVTSMGEFSLPLAEFSESSECAVKWRGSPGAEKGWLVLDEMPAWSQFDCSFRGPMKLEGSLTIRELGQRVLLMNRTRQHLPPSWLHGQGRCAAVPAMGPGASHIVRPSDYVMSESVPMPWRSERQLQNVGEALNDYGRSRRIWIIPGGIADYRTSGAFMRQSMSSIVYDEQAVLLVVGPPARTRAH